ncbi:MAG: hypothetical protein A2804_00400 [Candidatus Pacebacteria bacterium RIFCSPHIGHO2_01_FULL_46_10]|nr:MAG: hypothetical protein A2804_00400 [Candidatus Pacebacteria bacterium RIFCSPHIGHO2_01_FULL_46_10]
MQSNKQRTKTKLLFLARLYAPHIGGVEKHVAQLSEQLVKRGYKITVITEQFNTALPLRETQKNVEIYRIPKKQRETKLGIWRWMFNHRSLVEKTDIIHAHDVFWWYLPLRFMYITKPVYTTFHGYEGSQPPTQKAVRSRKLAELLSHGNICVGEWMKTWYGTHPTAILHGAGKARLSRSPRENSAVFIGRIDEDTGVLAYIEAVKLLRGKISLDMYGEGSLLSKLKSHIENVPYIKYKGVTKTPEIILAKYRFACVSRYLSMIEAMQIGRYVFAQWNNAIKRDYLKSFPAVQWCSVSSLPEDIAQEMMYIIDHPEREKSAVHNAQTWAKKQTWERVADVYESLWQTSR